MQKLKKYFMLDFVRFSFAPLRRIISRKGERLRLMAETTIKAQLINWFQAVKMKIRPKAFVLPTTTPKKSRNMSHFFW